MRNRLALIAACMMALASAPLDAAPVTVSSTSEATAEKAPPRKTPEARERKRSTQSSVARGCVGCISPLDGISTAMAVRTLN